MMAELSFDCLRPPSAGPTSGSTIPVTLRRRARGRALRASRRPRATSPLPAPPRGQWEQAEVSRDGSPFGIQESATRISIRMRTAEGGRRPAGGRRGNSLERVWSGALSLSLSLSLSAEQRGSFVRPSSGAGAGAAASSSSAAAERSSPVAVGRHAPARGTESAFGRRPSAERFFQKRGDTKGTPAQQGPG